MDLVLSPLLDKSSSKGKLYAGKWCFKLGTDPQEHKTLDYPWNDRDQLYRDYVYLEELHERCLESLVQSLNLVHSSEHTLVFWRALLGPWLINFNSAVLEKIRVLEQAKSEARGLNLRVVNPPYGQVSSRDYIDFGQLSLQDGFHLLLFSRIARKMDGFSLMEEEYSFNWDFVERETHSIKQQVLKRLPKLQQNIFFANTFFPLRDLLFLQTRFNKIPSTDKLPTICVNANFDTTKRLQLKKKLCRLARNEEESLFLELISEFLPLSYLEGFKSLKTLARRYFPKRPQLILSGNAHYSHDGFKAWLGLMLEAGAKFAVVQHGGLFGAAKWCAFETHDLKVASRYFSWGWSKKNESKICPSPAPRLMRVSPRKKPNNDGKILLVTNGFPKYFYRPLSAPVGEQTLDFLELDFDFVRALGKVKKNLRVRLYHADQGWSEHSRWEKAQLDVDYQPSGLSLREEIASARLFVGTHNTTTFLEAFIMNVPSIVYWNPQHWELRDEAMPFYEQLREAGILFDNPEQAAAQVKEVFHDPHQWWGSARVKKARSIFCAYFARTSQDATEQWFVRIKNTLESFQEEAGTIVLPSIMGETHARI